MAQPLIPLRVPSDAPPAHPVTKHCTGSPCVRPSNAAQEASHKLFIWAGGRGGPRARPLLGSKTNACCENGHHWGVCYWGHLLSARILCSLLVLSAWMIKWAGMSRFLCGGKQVWPHRSGPIILFGNRRRWGANTTGVGYGTSYGI